MAPRLAVPSSPSPRAEGGEGWGEEGRFFWNTLCLWPSFALQSAANEPKNIYEDSGRFGGGGGRALCFGRPGAGGPRGGVSQSGQGCVSQPGRRCAPHG